MKNNPKRIQRVALVANAAKPSVRTIVRRAVRLLRSAGCDILGDVSTAALAGLPIEWAMPAASLARAADLLLVFGGDGTMLRAVREAAGSRTPILGLNAGHLGFLTAVPSKELESALRQVLDGLYSVESRSLIQAAGEASGSVINFHALNDIVISRGSASRMIELDVEVDGALLTRYRCDGLIISSPTGSTAYSLSAGGAIISPCANVFAITPICPHTLSNRSVIVGMGSMIRVTVVSEKVETTVTADGQINAPLDTGDSISIQRARRDVRLVHLNGGTFFETVRRKLHWSGSNV